MPSSPETARTLLRPGPDFTRKPVPATRQPARTWFRVHRSGSAATEFSKLACHRFSHADCPSSLLYLGSNIQTCLWETFGDDLFLGRCTIAASKWAGRCVSRISVPELTVCALSLERTREAMGVDKASLLAADLRLPQEWGLAVQQHPDGFQAIKYTSRFLDRPCLALFDRGELVSQLRVARLGDLNDLDAAVDWLTERKAALV